MLLSSLWALLSLKNRSCHKNCSATTTACSVSACASGSMGWTSSAMPHAALPSPFLSFSNPLPLKVSDRERLWERGPGGEVNPPRHDLPSPVHGRGAGGEGLPLPRLPTADAPSSAGIVAPGPCPPE